MVNQEVLDRAERYGLRTTEIVISVPLPFILENDKEALDTLIETHLENHYVPRFRTPAWSIWGYDISKVDDYQGSIEKYKGQSIPLLVMTLMVELHRYVYGSQPEYDYLDEEGLEEVHCSICDSFLCLAHGIEDLEDAEEVILHQPRGDDLSDAVVICQGCIEYGVDVMRRIGADTDI